MFTSSECINNKGPSPVMKIRWLSAIACSVRKNMILFIMLIEDGHQLRQTLQNRFKNHQRPHPLDRVGALKESSPFRTMGKTKFILVRQTSHAILQKPANLILLEFLKWIRP